MDTIQIWIHAYIDWVVKHDRYTGKITHYKTVEGYDAWSIPAFKDTYFTELELLKAWKDIVDDTLPNALDVLDQWNEFIRRLKLLGILEEE